MSPDDHRHGTPAGRRAHQRAGTPTCAPCRAAHAKRIAGIRASRERTDGPRPCWRCGIETYGDQGCRSCRHWTRTQPLEPGPEHALRGGRWVKRKAGIRQWEEAS